MSVIDDGTYEAMVIEARPSEDGAEDVLHIEIAISSGPHKGEVVAVRGRFPGRSDIDLLGAPATLTVSGGEPAVALDDPAG